MQTDDTGNNLPTSEAQEQQAREMILDLIRRCPRVRQNPNGENTIRKAFELANNAHRGVKRKSGELYIFHPIAVATIAAEEMGLGSVSVAAALLHDVVEDTEITLTDIESLFGPKVAQIVDGLTKLETVFDQTENESLQAENFRKLLVSMIEDVRVILIKLADRLHNMRTLDSMPEHKRYKIAAETLYIYAPIAHRLGLFAVKTELEDLSLKYEHPRSYKQIEEKVKDKDEEFAAIIKSIEDPIRAKLDAKGLKYTIKARTKSIYSIWNKMQTKFIPFEEIYDILAMRIIFEPKEDQNEKAQCWDIYSDITDLFNTNQERLRDWVSTPKSNGYEALHTTVMSPSGKWVEIQIRTTRMDLVDERGYAAHWSYKENRKDTDVDKWINSVREILEKAYSSSIEFLDAVKLNLFAQEISVFTPKGEMKVMPKDSTALDFAFEIHSNLGYHCIGVKVNYKLAPISQVLKSGDQVEILTSEKEQTKYEWIEFVKTAKAKNCIREACRDDRNNNIDKGEEMLNVELQKRKLTLNNRILHKLLFGYNLKTKDELLYQIGRGTVDLSMLDKLLTHKSIDKWIKIWKIDFSNSKQEEEDDDFYGFFDEELQKLDLAKQKNIIITDDSQLKYEIAQCCTPIPGDDIVAYIDETNNHITLHKRNCPECIKLMASKGDRIVATQWKSHKVKSYLTEIEINGLDRHGVVSDITRTIALEQMIKMRSVKFEAHDGIFSGNIFLYIHDVNDLNILIENIKKIKGVDKVLRKEFKF